MLYSGIGHSLQASPQLSKDYKQRSPEDIRVKPLRAEFPYLMRPDLMRPALMPLAGGWGATSDDHVFPVEGGDFEPFEILPGVNVTLVA